MQLSKTGLLPIPQVKMKIQIVILKLLFLGALFIISNQNLHLLDDEERGLFFDSYSTWLDNMFNQGMDITGYVVKFEWLPPKDGYEERGTGFFARGSFS